MASDDLEASTCLGARQQVMFSRVRPAVTGTTAAGENIEHPD
jgi:hypothetical protein